MSTLFGFNYLVDQKMCQVVMDTC